MELHLTHLCRVDSSTITIRIGPFPKERVSSSFSLLTCTMFKEIRVLNANSVDPDQTPHSAASDLSDLGLHCSPMSLFMGR